VVDFLTFAAACALAVNYSHSPITDARPRGIGVSLNETQPCAEQRRVRNRLMQCAAAPTGSICGGAFLQLADVAPVGKPAEEMPNPSLSSDADAAAPAPPVRSPEFAVPPVLRAIQDGERQRRQSESEHAGGALFSSQSAPSPQKFNSNRGPSDTGSDAISDMESDPSGTLFVPLGRGRSMQGRSQNR
jgi:hypothetical protein